MAGAARGASAGAEPLRSFLLSSSPYLPHSFVGAGSDQSSSQGNGGRSGKAKGATERGREADEYESTSRQW